MPIAKGQPWGQSAPRPPGLVVAADDVDLARLVLAAKQAGENHPVLGVSSGDLLRTLGFPPVAPVSTEPVPAMHFPMDLGFVTIDGAAEQPFVAHVLARGPLWSGPGFVAMNAGWLGEMYLGPKAHPNDGLVDTTHGSLALQQRWQARSRVRSGTHLPHQRLKVRRAREVAVALDVPRPLRRMVWIDGVRHGRGTALSVRVEPDAFTLVVEVRVSGGGSE